VQESGERLHHQQHTERGAKERRRRHKHLRARKYCASGRKVKEENQENTRYKER
jgi:hypothetical protein